ncbi:uncharacterized protein Y057_11241 [Fusarium fujikuroi]|nr:uncharacterized protein Y057_11241 [Fusarium fujikuroi]
MRVLAGPSQRQKLTPTRPVLRPSLSRRDADVPATAQASVISGDDDKDDDDKSSTGTASGTSTSTGTSSSSSETSTESGNAAAGFAPKSSINTLGLAIGALLFSSMAAGAFQL